MRALITQIKITLLWAVRDRVLHAVFGVGVLLLLLVPVFSDFSMRQVQESAIALALSGSSLTLIAIAALVGSAAVFRDVDRRYSAALFGLPLSRSSYLLGKLFGLAIFLFVTGLIMFLCSAAVIVLAASSFPSQTAIPWATIALAFAADTLRGIVLASVALMFSALSTSFTLPFFCTLGIWLAGSASQQAYEYVTGSLGQDLNPIVQVTAQVLYYLLPNFAGLNFHLQAIYGLPVFTEEVLTSFLYSGLYAAVIVWLATYIFNRRELP